jgi:hypothetical protein
MAGRIQKDEIMKTMKAVLIVWILAVLVLAGGSRGRYRGNQTTDFSLEVAKGNVLGHKSVNKFGSSSFIQVTPTDVWDKDQTTWLAPTSAQTHQIISTSDADSDTGGTVAQGAGARTIQVYGLQDWDSKETSEIVTMDGTATGGNAINTANSYVIIHRMIVLTTGSTGPFSNVGTISAIANSDGTTTAQIAPIKGQTQMAIYGVPSTQKAYMYNFAASIAHNSPGPTIDAAGIIILQSTDIVNNPTVFTFKHTASIQDNGLTSLDSVFPLPKVFEGPCIIKIAMVALAEDSLCDASFDIVVVDNGF